MAEQKKQKTDDQKKNGGGSAEEKDQAIVHDEPENKGGPAVEAQRKSTPKDDPEAALAEALCEKEATTDRLLRVCADYDNYKKRINREMSDLRKYAHETFSRELLSVVDNLERAIENASQSAEGLLEGVRLTHKELLKVFEKFNIKSFESLHEPFDPEYHQAMMQEASDAYPENTVIRELQKGYRIHERLLRPAMVVVSKPAASGGKNEEKNPVKL